MSFQGHMSGNQVGKLFKQYNEQEGSAVVDLTRNYNVGDSYSTRIGTGNQIDLAFKEINAYRGDDVFGVNHIDWGNGKQLKAAFAKFILLIGSADNPPVWLSSLPLNVEIIEGSPWPWACATYSWSSIAISPYTFNLSIPPGINLGADGIFVGTASAVSSGTIELLATNANGTTASEWIKWAVISA